MAPKNTEGFIPNARIVIKRKSTFVKLATDDVANPLYGKVEDGTDDSDGYDERKYKNSALRHSPLFEKMAKLRKNGERIDFFRDKTEKYSDSQPYIPGEYESYEDACFEIDNDRKRIIFGQENEIELWGGDTATWKTGDPMSPELIFKKGERISCALFPQIDFLLHLGISPDIPQKNCLTYEMTDTLTKEGGSFELGYIIELGGMEAENTKLSITVYPEGAKNEDF